MTDANTKQPRQSTQWIGTYNNIDLTIAREYLESWVTKQKASYACGQIEKGEEGTIHLQFVVIFPKSSKKSLTSLKKVCTNSHFEVIKCLDESIDYV